MMDDHSRSHGHESQCKEMRMTRIVKRLSVKIEIVEIKNDHSLTLAAIGLGFELEFSCFVYEVSIGSSGMGMVYGIGQDNI